MRKILQLWAVAIFVPLVSSFSHAEVTLPNILSDDMVLQREVPIHFWGLANPGESVTVRFLHEAKTDRADEFGHWNVYLNPAQAGGPYEVSVEANNKIILHNVLVGDVWVASGQSNMEFPMSKLANSDTELAAANQPMIRILKVKKNHSDFPLDNVSGVWEECTTRSAADSSAVAYYFARQIQSKEKIPVGVIESYIGGTVAEAWTSMHALTSDAALMPVLANRAKMMEDLPRTKLLVIKEKKLQEQARENGQPEPRFAWHPEPYMWQPAALFNAMIYPLTPYGIKGVIWYQGESNSLLARAPFYERQFQTLIRDWRDHWGQGDFPFLYVQIANYKSTPEEDWATVRDAQRKALSLRNTAMAVTIDIGDPEDVHPQNKREVGNRLALLARATVYGEQLEYSGPLFRQLTSEPKSLRVWFSHAEGLHVEGPSARAFEVAGEDGKYHSAEATVQGSTIVLSNANVEHPISVRYGWLNSPDCNVFNQAGLPASPFQARLPTLQ